MSSMKPPTMPEAVFCMLSIMTEQKKPEKNDITLSGEKLRKYFPRSYTPFQIENTIFKLLDAWQKKRQRDQSR